MAVRDWLKITISGAAIIALIVAVRQYGVQTSALLTQGEQLKTQAEQLKAQQAARRPWLKVGDPRVASAFPVSDNGGAFAVDLKIENFGSSPALNVEVEAKIQMLKSNLGGAAIQEDICKKLKERPTGDNGNGFAIFPRESRVHRLSISVQPGNVSAGVKSMGLPDQSFAPIMIGCIRYLYPGVGSQGETGFAYDVSHLPPHSLLQAERGDVPAEEIMLVQPMMLNSRIN
ncbi:hypothetical protein AB7645_05530 [Bradyrhizobium sp. 956_D2_N1_5]|uniref:hypothetical protein n=1 Tax=unclassified Bradyrhizobium TaxID=2631580 RepID=UPI003F2820D0